MTVLLVVSILALILSPLSWLRSSRKQSEQMKLRLEARRMGLAMQLAPQQWPHWLEKEPPSPCPQYHRARRRGHEDSFSFWQVSPGVWWNQWREPCEDPRFMGALSRLPHECVQGRGRCADDCPVLDRTWRYCCVAGCCLRPRNLGLSAAHTRPL